MLEKLDEPLYIFIYTVSDYEGEITSCDEGTLEWIEDNKILDLELWEGDRLFWSWIFEGKELFSANFTYKDDKLIDHKVEFYD
jgi:8-oxo-dGTP diphosphatase